MIFRSLVASTYLAGFIFIGNAQSQVLLCPEAPPERVSPADIAAEAERLLARLTIALDLHGHRGISEQSIMDVHASTPSALLAKLANVADRCVQASGDLDTFYEALPDLRMAFLEATDVSHEASPSGDAEGEQAIEAVALKRDEAERVEQSIDLSVRQLWRKLWFRPAQDLDTSENRWAVIVASPSDADSGWDELGRHQRRWKDAYFQLHEPYYDTNPHHAIVVGRRLPEGQANRLRDYVIELGMAKDAYLWQLPESDLAVEAPANAASDKVEEVAEDRTEAAVEPETQVDESSPRQNLDLSVLDQ